MTQAINRDRLLYRAILASLALHVALIALIPPLAVSEGSRTVETIAFVHVAKIAILRPTPNPTPAVMAQARMFAPAPRVTAPHAHTARPHPARKTHVSPTPQAERAPVVATLVHTGDAAATVRDDAPVASPSSAPAQPPAQSVASRQTLGGMMPLGAEEPIPVLEPSVRKALLALGVHVTLTVTVDGHGHTETVAFAPPLADDVESKIRAMLASASWDPAVCGAGLTCEASATIKL